MCGRFALYRFREKLQQLYEELGIAVPEIPQWTASYNIPPYSNVPVVYSTPDGKIDTREMFWQLIPSFAKKFESKYTMFNSRSESFDKHDFREKLLLRCRCVFPVDNFYEWQKTGDGKVPFAIQFADGQTMLFGGIYSIWTDENQQPRYSCSIITVPANKTMSPVHHRMPFILDRGEAKNWLNGRNQKLDQLRSMIRSLPDGLLELYPVDKAVGNARNDYPELIEPINQE